MDEKRMAGTVKLARILEDGRPITAGDVCTFLELKDPRQARPIISYLIETGWIHVARKPNVNTPAIYEIVDSALAS